MRHAVLFLWLLLTVLVLSGCASTESENMSSRPWNAPTGYESGLPIGIMQGH